MTTRKEKKKLNLHSIAYTVKYKRLPFMIYARLDKTNAPRCEQDAPRNEKKINFAVRPATVLLRLALTLDPDD